MVCDFLGKINTCETINTAQDSFGNFALIDLEFLSIVSDKTSDLDASRSATDKLIHPIG
jgi:hypothetical protein